MNIQYEHQDLDSGAACAMVSMRAVSQRYGVTPRTIHRWIARDKLAFPRPIYINTRRYWFVAELAAWERATRGEITVRCCEQER